MDKWEAIENQMRVLVQKQEEVREAMKDLALSIELKRVKETGEHLSVDEWRKRKAEVLYRIGLGPKPQRWVNW